MSSATKVNECVKDNYVDLIVENVRAHGSLTTEQSGSSAVSATRTVSGRLAGLVAPIAAVAALAAPVPDFVYRTRRWGNPSATVPVLQQHWMEDSWKFTRAKISQAEIEALNALLALPVVEGFSFGTSAE
jgi:hypothetical protein